MTPNTSLEKATRPLRIVKIGSEGIAIKPDTGDLKTDMQTVAMCGLDEKLARMFAAAPDMLAALQLDATADKLERDDPEQSQMAIASFREAAKEARKAAIAKAERGQ